MQQTHYQRTIVSQMLAGYTLDQLNTIQKDSNNLIWNIAHIIVQQMVYKLSITYDDFRRDGRK
jgi:hypothetical protein